MKYNKVMTGVLVAALFGVSIFASGCVIRATPLGGAVVYTQPPPPPGNRVVVSARPAAPYAGAVWVEGHYEWRGNRHVWVRGRWIRPRAGHMYVQPRWVRRGNGWVYEAGRWRRGQAVRRPARPAVRAQPAPPPAGGVRVQVRKLE